MMSRLVIRHAGRVEVLECRVWLRASRVWNGAKGRAEPGIQHVLFLDEPVLFETRRQLIGVIAQTEMQRS